MRSTIASRGNTIEHGREITAIVTTPVIFGVRDTGGSRAACHPRMDARGISACDEAIRAAAPCSPLRCPSSRAGSGL